MASSDQLGYNVSEILVGIVVSDDQVSYAENQVAKQIRKTLPDRLRTIVLTPSSKAYWPTSIQLLLVCCSRPNFPSEITSEYVQQHSPGMVLTDLDLQKRFSDCKTLYNWLQAGGLSIVLPRRAIVEQQLDASQPQSVIDRRDQIEIDGTILYKPVLERPISLTNTPNSNPIVKVYYPRSQGGGCKTITFLENESKEDYDPTKQPSSLKCNATFDPQRRYLFKLGNDNSSDIETSDPQQSYIYEELASVEDIRLRKRQRKRDVAMTKAMSFVKKMAILDTAEDYKPASRDDDDQVLFESDLSRLDRKIWVVTTASLPWMTGTAVNPLLRVAYLKQQGRQSVTLVIPWLEREADRQTVYGAKHSFQSPEDQEVYVRDWLKNQAGMPAEADPTTGIQIMWYPSRYYSALGSIFPTSDICKQIPDQDADYCILEEPEHLNWFRANKGEEEGEIWREKFTHVVGVIHTNYKAYASSSAAIAAPIISGLSTLMVRAYCDKVIKLSATLQTYSPEKEVVCNVHGVRADFLREGKRRAKAFIQGGGQLPQVAIDHTGTGEEKPAAYFIGKLLWEKGLDRILSLEYFYKEVTGEFFPIDIVGDGPDRPQIEPAFLGEESKTIRKILAEFSGSLFSWGAATMQDTFGTVLELPDSMKKLQTSKIPGQFHGRQDHAEFCSSYKVLVNPSVTEVLCTTVAEALAMGKFAVIPKHPSNEFFYQFPNCLAYDTKVDFVKNIAFALANEPEPLSDELSHVFTWEAATERLVTSSAITMREGRARAKAKKGKIDDDIAKMYNKFGAGAHSDVLKMVFQGGAEEGEEGGAFKFFKKKATGSTS